MQPSVPEGTEPPRPARPRTVALLVAPLLFGVVVAADVFLLFLRHNHRPLLGEDSLPLLLGLLAVLGAPAAIAFGVLGWLGRRRPALAPALLVGAHLLLLAAAWLRGRHGFEAFAVRHLPILLFLVGATLLAWRPPRRQGLLLLGWTALTLGGSLALNLSTGTFPLAAAPPPEGMLPRGPVRATKLVVIGVDGLGWETLGRWKSAGGSDDLTWFEDHALVTALTSVVPTESPRIWSSVATGYEPSEHGVLSFTSNSVAGLRRPLLVPHQAGGFLWVPPLHWLGLVRAQPVSRVDLRRRPLWEIIDDPELPVTVVGWWASWPAVPVHGRIVSNKFYFWRDNLLGDETPQVGLTYPHPLEKEIDDLRVAPDSLSRETMAHFVPASDDALQAGSEYQHHELLSELPLAISMDQTYYAVARRFLAEPDARGVYFLYFRGIDLVSHSAIRFSDLYPESSVDAGNREKYGALISRYYAWTFAELRRLVELAGEDAVVLILSDHGFERLSDEEYGHENAPPGILIARGGGHGAVDALQPPHLYDIAPTVLWLTGYPLAEDMPGRPLRELFPDLEGAGAGAQPLIATYGESGIADSVAGIDAAEADERMMQLLRSLGYID